MREELISVVVPIYNVEKYLPRCVESIIAQTYSNLEIFLVNDGSKDSSLDICKHYAELDSRICIIDKKNGGLSDARNAGIERATGEYIIFIDSDDYIHKRMVEILYENIKKYDADISVCNYMSVLDEDKCNTEEVSEGNVMVLQHEAALAKYFKSLNLILTLAWNKLYKRELFAELRYPVGRIHEDEALTYKLIYNSNCLVYTDQKLYFYVQRANSIIGEGFSLRSYDKVIACNERYEFFKYKNMKLPKAKSAYQYLVELYFYMQNVKQYLPENIEELKRVEALYCCESKVVKRELSLAMRYEIRLMEKDMDAYKKLLKRKWEMIRTVKGLIK